jgi:hypothetical protein
MLGTDRDPLPPGQIEARIWRWAAPVLIAVALFLLPWTVWLTWVLPSRHVSEHWNLAWAGFDVALAASIALTGVGVYRRATWLQGAAMASGVLLLVDAWFDVTLSSGGASRMGAVAEAVFSEIPIALFAFWIAADTVRFWDRWQVLTSRAGRPEPGRE